MSLTVHIMVLTTYITCCLSLPYHLSGSQTIYKLFKIPTLSASGPKPEPSPLHQQAAPSVPKLTSLEPRLQSVVSNQQTTPLRHQADMTSHHQTAQQLLEKTAPELFQQTAPEQFQQTAPQAFQQTAQQSFQKTAPESFQQTATQPFQQTASQLFQKTAPQSFKKTAPQSFQQTAPQLFHSTASQGVQQRTPSSQNDRAPQGLNEMIQLSYVPRPLISQHQRAPTTYTVVAPRTHSAAPTYQTAPTSTFDPFPQGGIFDIFGGAGYSSPNNNNNNIGLDLGQLGMIRLLANMDLLGGGLFEF